MKPTIGEIRKGGRLIEYLMIELEHANDAASAQALALDPGEYVWFREVTSDSQPPGIATLDEARRALAFVFWWIIRWEAFCDSYIPDRWARREIERRRPRAGAEPARVSSVQVTGEYGGLTARIGLENIPAESEFEIWAHFLSGLIIESIPPAGPARRIMLGSGELLITIGNLSPQEMAELIRECLAKAEIQLADHLAERASDRRQREEEAAAYLSDYSEISALFPEWVKSVGFAGDESIHNGSRLSIELSEDGERFGSEIQNSLTQQPSVAHCRRLGNRVFILPEMRPRELLNALQSCDELVAEEVREMKEKERRREEGARLVENELRRFFQV
ncbi:hypothetical protein ABZ611_34415 [Streptomyces sp. NPDC007861]|uniref:hypothetical protein n=1 Tax=Streptomyces sp. NPDC007861 TaxID=3154893 RepID=UPI00340A78EB